MGGCLKPKQNARKLQITTEWKENPTKDIPQIPPINIQNPPQSQIHIHNLKSPNTLKVITQRQPTNRSSAKGKNNPMMDTFRIVPPSEVLKESAFQRYNQNPELLLANLGDDKLDRLFKESKCNKILEFSTGENDFCHNTFSEADCTVKRGIMSSLPV